jgi:CxxC motif-containing protein
MLREFTCIVCPNGCDIEVNLADDGTITSITGAHCRGGENYVKQELTDPQRTIASSVPVLGGELPLVSVRLDKAIPKNRIFDVMTEIRKVTLTAPVHSGDIAIADVLGLGSNVIVTKDVAAV